MVQSITRPSCVVSFRENLQQVSLTVARWPSPHDRHAENGEPELHPARGRDLSEGGAAKGGGAPRIVASSLRSPP